jgi:hypothetical protein
MPSSMFAVPAVIVPEMLIITTAIPIANAYISFFPDPLRPFLSPLFVCYNLDR